MKGKWRRLILFSFLWSELIRVQFYFFFIFFYSTQVDPTRTGGPDFCTCLAKMFVCPVPKISHVMMKWCRRASHLGRFTLWHNRRWASQLAGKFTLWHNGRQAKHPGLMHAPGVARIFQRKIRDCWQSSGTTAAELNPVGCMHQESQTFSKDSDGPCWKIWRQKFKGKI